jgi:hypothetical protein
VETNGYEKAGVTMRNAKEICNLFIALSSSKRILHNNCQGIHAFHVRHASRREKFKLRR